MPHPLGLIPLCVLAVNAIAYSALLPLNDIADAHGVGPFAHAFWQTLLGGTLLAVAVAIAAPWALACAAVGRWLLVQPNLPLGLTVGTAWLVVVLMDWLRRIDWP